MAHMGPCTKKQRPRIRAASQPLRWLWCPCGERGTRLCVFSDESPQFHRLQGSPWRGWMRSPQDSFMVLQNEAQPRIVKLRWQFRESPKPREIPVIAREDLKASLPMTVSSNMVASSDTWQDFAGGSVVENLPAMQKTQVPSLGREDPLENEMANHSGILAWEITRTEESGRLQSTGLQKSRTWLSNWTITTKMYLNNYSLEIT